MAFLGMDIEQVEDLAVQLDARAEGVDEIIQAIEGKVGATDWRGADADRFRDEWSSVSAPALRRVAEMLRESANAARQNAQEQRSAAS